MEGEGGALFAHYDLFFPFDSQIARIFYPKKRLAALMVVTCVTHGWILVQAERVQSTAFLSWYLARRGYTQALCLLSGWGGMFGSGL